MTARLQVYDRRERWLVRLADLAVSPLPWLRRLRRPPRAPVHRVLLLRLERIGDLLMVLEAVRTARDVWPDAEIDLAVGSWNAPLAALVPAITSVRIADAPWLARAGRARWRAFLGTAWRWRARHYDVVVNFEPDLRSNFVAWITGAARRVGYDSGGGGALLTDAGPYDPGRHVGANAVRLIGRAAGAHLEAATSLDESPRLQIPVDSVARATAILAGARRPLVAVHPAGGRESKQWHLDRFADVARALAATRDATIVLTGSQADRSIVDTVRAQLDDVRVIDACDALDVPGLAALFAACDLVVSGDTGPMHLAAAVGTPLVALFGPSDPRRYGPLGTRHRILRVDLPCSPCGQVRLPPARCRGHVPDCLDGISVATVVQAANELLPASIATPAVAR